jgi:alkanesulfonate monooxygenase SsuD/methylene tetrahydromethanopterin reductase-like flavin-dependent oxidoreductase (luciferase family)
LAVAADRSGGDAAWIADSIYPIENIFIFLE